MHGACLCAWAGVHMALILREPYLGGTLVYGPIMLAHALFRRRAVHLSSGGHLLRRRGDRDSAYLDLLLRCSRSSWRCIPSPISLCPAPAGRARPSSCCFWRPRVIFCLWWLLRELQFRIPWQYPLFLSLIVAVGVYTAHIIQHLIKDYQSKRLVVFFSPGFDPLGAGYHILQSQIAIGSGRFFGKGLFSGSQTQLGFLPEKHTDFIFSVIGEEMGFFWAAMVIIAFGVLVWRSFVIATESQDRFGSLIAVGVGMSFRLSVRHEYRHDVGAASRSRESPCRLCHTADRTWSAP